MQKLHFSIFNIVFLSLVLFNTAFAEKVNITDAWISEAPPTVSVLAGYLNVQNNSDVAITLVSASSPDFARIEIHRSIIKGEIVSMEKQNVLKIPAGEILKLTPGDFHLMLFDPIKPMRSGDKASINFAFADGHSQTIEANIERRRAGADHAHHHHNH